ncbi:MAG: aspartate aminotransferase [Myxococcales bacterium]|nr:aspartate aminotransferase [Myxococcales bacterium]
MSNQTQPIQLNQLIQTVQPSPTLAVTALAARLKSEGRDIVSFGAGQPDFDTPERIREAAKRAIDEGHTRYTNVGGMPELLEAIAADYNARGYDVTPANVAVSCGAKHTLYALNQVLIDPGDEVIIPAPYWVSYPSQAILAGGRPVFISGGLEQGFKITAEQLAAAITPKTKALVLNSPSNPTGAVYTREELEAIADVVLEHRIVVLYDAIYGKLVYGGAEATEFALLRDGLADLTITVDGLSKSHAMTGWRMGFMVGPVHVTKAVAKLQSQSTSNITAFVQTASIEAFNRPQPELPAMLEHFDRRRKLTVKLLRAIDGVTCLEPKGAFYVFPDFSAYIGRTGPDGPIADDVALATYLLNHHNVAIVPGSAFGAPGHARLSYATSDANIEKGCARIAEGLSALS